jgi:benzoylformate decarboxylase
VVGAGADDPDTWAALTRLAERLGCPVWQEAFGSRAGFPQDHACFAGHLPAGRSRLREALAGHDLVLTVGAAVFRQYQYEPGPLVGDGTRLALVTADPAEAHRSPAELVLLAAPAPVCRALAEAVSERDAAPVALQRPGAPEPPADGAPLSPGHVLAELAARLHPETVLVEEAPSARPELLQRIPARRPMGFVAAAMGGLGFGISAPIGLRMALPERPVVAVIGDGAAMYAFQVLWSAARYEAGVLFVVLNNGGYRVMDRLAEGAGESAPWPSFETIDLSAMARAQGCEARRVTTHAELTEALDEAIPGLASRSTPLLLETMVAADPQFQV